MPIYEYKCPKGHVFEVFQRMSDPAVEVCEDCGAGPVERVLYPVAVHFKGSGFYSTDYGRSRKNPRDGGDSSPGDSKSSDSGSGSGDSGSSGDSGGGSASTSGGDGGSGGDKPAVKKTAEA